MLLLFFPERQQALRRRAADHARYADRDLAKCRRRMSCDNAIWEHAAALIKSGINPDKLSHDALAAELTDHLVDGAVLIPGAAGTLPELQQVGFQYAK
jgi:hypothetical protein